MASTTLPATAASAPLPASGRNGSGQGRLVLSRWNGKLVALLLLAALYLTSLTVAFLTENTYDGGDSIYHYLFAHFAFQHPENLLNAWAKPFFTLLASGPAQGGFLGMKLFQCTVVAASAWLAYLLARALQLPWPALAIVLCYGAPDYFRIQFSGLTEPLFGLVLVGATVLAAYNKPSWSALTVSWLPFVRSEGFILLGLWGVYLLWQRQWKALPLLGLGYGAYSVVGGIFLGNFGWISSSNPYLVNSQYGSGRWTHFLEHIPTLLGWIPTALALLGGMLMVGRMLRRSSWAQRLFRVELLLVYGSITVFILFHSVAWALGMFSSFGMTRVLTVLTPFFAIVSLAGLAGVSKLGAWAPRARVGVMAVVISAVIVMLFRNDYTYTTTAGTAIGWHSTLHWHRDFVKLPDLQLADKATAWLKQHDANWRWHPIAFEHTYYAIPLHLDLYDPAVRPLMRQEWTPHLEALPVGTYVFWDGWFCPVDAHIPLHLLSNDSRFKGLWQDSTLIFPGWPEGGYFKAVLFKKVR